MESVTNQKRNNKRPRQSEAVEVAILGNLAVDPTLHTRQLASVSGVSRNSPRTAKR